MAKKTTDVLVDPLINNNPIALQILGICFAQNLRADIFAHNETNGIDGTQMNFYNHFMGRINK